MSNNYYYIIIFLNLLYSNIQYKQILLKSKNYNKLLIKEKQIIRINGISEL
jgi:hypothetical protein